MGNGRPDRRRFLRWGAAGAAAGLAGCQVLGLFGGSSVPDASFAFEYDPAGGQNGGSVTVRHDGGDAVRADVLSLESSAGHEARWHELGSTDVAAAEDVTAGDTARLDATVINWPADVARDERIKAIYRREGALSTLGEFVPDVTPTPTPTVTSTPGQTPTPEQTPAPSTLLADYFEADNGLEPFEIDPGTSSTYDYGTAASDAPDGGSYHAYVAENSRGQGSGVAAVSNAGIRWDRTYRFEFLVRCSDWGVGVPYSNAQVRWRTAPTDESDRLKLRLFNTDGSGERRTFKVDGKGVVESQTETLVDWEANTWYRFRGEVRERPEEETATVRAKVWPAAESEPAEPGARALATNGVARQLHYDIFADGRGGDGRVQFDVAHVSFTLP